MTDQELTDLAKEAAEALWALEAAHPGVDFTGFHGKCEKLFDALTADKPGVVKPDGGGPK